MNVNWDCFGNFNCLKERNLSLQGGETTGKDGEGKPCIPGDKRKPWKHPAPGRKTKSKHDKYKERLKMSGRPGHIFYEIPGADLHPDPHYPSYNLGQYSSMVSKVWGSTRVRIRRYSGDKETLQNRELEVLGFLTHPNILLLMGVSYTQHSQNLVFEHVQLGSLHTRIHLQKKVPTLIVCVDILLQITDALIFIHSRGYIHCALSSHAVQLVSPFLAKLARFEYASREGSGDPVLSLSSLESTNFYSWLSPAVLSGTQPSAQSDIYSFCTIIWELATGRKPWGDLSAREVYDEVVVQGTRLPLDKRTMPRNLFQLINVGLNNNKDYLDLQEIRDMLLITRKESELEHVPGSEKRNVPAPGGQKDRSRRSCPTSEKVRSSISSQALQVRIQPSNLSRSLIQLGKYGLERYQDFSFISDPAKREFLRSNQQNDKGSLSSLREGVDLSSGESSPELRGICGSSSSCDSSDSERGRKSSDSGIHILPSSGSQEDSEIKFRHFYGSEGEILASPENSTNKRVGGRGSRLYESLRSRRDGERSRQDGERSRQDGENRRSRRDEENFRTDYSEPRSRVSRPSSIPRSNIISGRSDYETGIKPASHRVGSHIPSIPGSRAFTPSYPGGRKPSPGGRKSSPPGLTRPTGVYPEPSATSDNNITKEDEDFSNSALYQTALEEQISAPTRKPINPENLKWAQGPPRHRTGSSNPDRGLGSSVELIGGHVCATMLPTVNSVGERDRFGRELRKEGEKRNHVNPGLLKPGENIKHQRKPEGKKGMFMSFWNRNPRETVVAAKACDAADSPPRADWNLNQGGVKSIVSSLEGLYPSASLYTTAPNTSPPVDIPCYQSRKISGAEFQTPPKVYQTPAEKVSDLLRRPTPTHNPKKYDIPVRYRRSQDGLNNIAPGRGRNRLSCNLDELRSVGVLRQVQSLLNNDVSVINPDPELGRRKSCNMAEDMEHLPPPPQIHTARILKMKTQTPTIMTLRTSTPQENRSRISTSPQSREESRQSAFQDALLEAGDLSDTLDSCCMVSAPGETRIQPQPKPSQANLSTLSRDSFVTVANGEDSVQNTERSEMYETAPIVPHIQSVLRSPNPGLCTAGGSGGEQRRQSNVTFSSNIQEITHSSFLSSLNAEDGGSMDNVNMKRFRYSLMSSCRSSVSGCSVPETEDLYCDDELHPSLERNPNMQLFCLPPQLQSSIEYSNQQLFQSMDADSLLSMDMMESGPQSLRSEYTDTELNPVDPEETDYKEFDQEEGSQATEKISLNGSYDNTVALWVTSTEDRVEELPEDQEHQEEVDQEDQVEDLDHVDGEWNQENQGEQWDQENEDQETPRCQENHEDKKMNVNVEDEECWEDEETPRNEDDHEEEQDEEGQDEEWN